MTSPSTLNQEKQIKIINKPLHPTETKQITTVLTLINKIMTAEEFFKHKFGNELKSTDSWVIRFAEEFANQSKWVSVNDSVPEKSGCVLTIMENTQDQYISFYRNDRNTFEVYGLGRIQPVTDMKVTHWMPLPSPPNQQ